MKLFNLSMAVAIVSAIAAPAFANNSDDAFNGFKTVCAATAADYPAVIAASATDGWAVTQVTGGSTMPGVSVTAKAARKKSVSESALTLFATQGLTQAGGGLTVNTCTVSTDRGDLATVVAKAQGWLGFAPVSTTPDSTTFHLTMAGGAPQNVASDGINAAAASTGFETLTIKRNGNTLTLDLVKFKK